MQNSKRVDSAVRLGIRIGAIVAFALFVLASNTVNADGAAVPPILLVIAVSLVICLL